MGMQNGRGEKGKNTRRVKIHVFKSNSGVADCFNSSTRSGEGSTNLASFGRLFASCHLLGNAWEETGTGTPAYTCLYPHGQAAVSSRALGRGKATRPSGEPRYHL